jgi:hypothetical protein
MTESWNRLFSSLLTSSIWTEDDQTRLVWITMLALMDRHGYVGASVNGLARQAGVSLEAAEKAIAKFLGPDKYSRSPEYQGRRIEVADRGWNILNGPRFREMRDEEARRQYERERKRAQRSRKVPDCHRLSAHAEAEAEADSEAEADADAAGGGGPSGSDGTRVAKSPRPRGAAPPRESPKEESPDPEGLRQVQGLVKSAMKPKEV